MTLVRPEFDRSPLDRNPLRRTRDISTKPLSDSLTQVATPGEVLGFVRVQWNGYAALRGAHLATAVEVGCYASHGMALEALRQRPRTI
ncbi:hypothetical protein AX769_15745 [Frondihabitans sp. PAMC 28766]|uniref:hypothetical protein n=1 Tax=Frondihabitans sp. PAMC 28766 TaxID=1795630 RepID=UPI00078BF101|nr:hypothetical protein [Frondihabitans sp. PAMC 28766]AMM21315.1 hypothetical protein AX769_15745 [Frondihabitans sp. PAMC 28766]